MGPVPHRLPLFQFKQPYSQLTAFLFIRGRRFQTLFQYPSCLRNTPLKIEGTSFETVEGNNSCFQNVGMGYEMFDHSPVLLDVRGSGAKLDVLVGFFSPSTSLLFDFPSL
jgi:hypothetical protein